MRPASAHRLCTAPMMDWSDRHCRYFFRLLAPHARLYTEMVGTGALLHGDRARHLDFDPAEQPLALQLGGSETEELARCAELAARWRYDEINLNVGCPSERVQKGAFGACLMAEPRLVADCVRALRDGSGLEVSVKHRTGIDRVESYEFLRDFVGSVAEAGCSVFIVHARNAWLKGLSPKENRELPPLRYDLVRRLKREFPALTIVINGGLVDLAGIEDQLEHVDGVMLGRAAYHDSWLLAQADAHLFGAAVPARSRREVALEMRTYAERQRARGVALRQIARHMLGLYHGMPHARLWRRLLSDPARLAANDPALIDEAVERVEDRFVDAA